MGLTDEEKRMIGGSDAPALAGLHPNKRPIDVWRRIHLGEVEPENAAMRRGTLMEPVIREMARQDFGLELLGPRKLRDPKRPYVRASLDDVSREEIEVPVEFKSVSPWAAAEFGPSGSDQIPQWHLCQVQFYLAESGAPRARLVALVGVDDLREYTVHADAELQGMLFELVDRFHRDHVLTGTPPPADGSESFSRYVSAKYPTPTGDVVPASPEAEQWAKEYRASTAVAAVACERREKAKTELKQLIGDNRGLLFADGTKVLWSHVKGRESTDWTAVAAEAGITREQIARHTTRKAGYRVFRPSWKDSDNE
jgi:putative phage-type endonuclease